MEEDFDPMYEYNAPKFVDFLNMQEDQHVDEWFDQRDGDEGGIPILEDSSERMPVVNDPNAIRQYLGINPNEVTKDKQPSTSPTPIRVKTEETLKTKVVPDAVMESREQQIPTDARKAENPLPVQIKTESPVTENEGTMKDDEKTCKHENEGLMSSVENLLSSVQKWSSLKPTVLPTERLRKTVTTCHPSSAPGPKEHTTEESKRTEIKKENYPSDNLDAESFPVIHVNTDKVGEKPQRFRNLVTSMEDWNKGKTTLVANAKSSPQSKTTRESKRKRSSNDCKDSRSSVDSSKRRKSNQGVALPELTVPQTPDVLKRTANFTKPIIKSSEEIELARIEKERQEVARRKERLQKYYKEKAIRPVVVGPVRSVQELTHPQEFHLRTDERVKKHPPSPKPTSKEVPKSFPEYLRVNDTEKTIWKHNGPTVVKPFSFDKLVPSNKTKCILDESRKSVENDHQADKWKNRAPTKPVPFSFDKGTPTKKKECGETTKQVTATKTWKNHGPTKPMPFSFDQQKPENRKRKLSEGTDNTAGGYESIAKAIYNFQSGTPPRFRSRPVAEQNVGPDPIHNREEVKLTQPKTPKLSLRDRVRPVSAEVLSKEQREEMELKEMKSYCFKAKEFDKKIVECEGILGVPRVIPKQPTVPKGFNFKSDERAEIHKQKDISVMEVDEEEKTIIKAHPVPHFVYEEPKKPELQHKKTEPAPFSFDIRDKQKLAHKEAKIKEMLEEEKRMHEFHAQPLPSLSPDVLEKQVKPVTKCEPFNINSKGALRAKEWAEKVEMELQEQRKKAVFKAHPNNVIHAVPFVPKKSNKPLTDVNEFKLNVERRAVEREELDTKKKEAEAINEEMRKQRELEMQEEEIKNIAILRKALVHKANPIRKFKKVHVKPSDVPLTNPMSPAWSDQYKRAKLR